MLNMATKILGHREPTERNLRSQKLLCSNNPLISLILHSIFKSNCSSKKFLIEHIYPRAIAFNLHNNLSGRQGRHLWNYVTVAKSGSEEQSDLPRATGLIMGRELESRSSYS